MRFKRRISVLVDSCSIFAAHLAHQGAHRAAVLVVHLLEVAVGLPDVLLVFLEERGGNPRAANFALD
jgi:hypothetical protein